MPADADRLLAGRYQLLAPRDTGTLADLRVAFDTRLQRTVTIKLARETDDEPGRGRYPRGVFAREAQLAASLQHPHLHPIYDYGEDAGEHYLVMRHFDETLHERLGRQPASSFMPLDAALSLFRSLAGAVDYLHAHGPVVHGNLKPHHIVLDTSSGAEAHAFVSDFGVAALGARRVGTPAYMAPEQAFGGEPGPAADRFALGIVFYECLTKSLPFPLDSLETLAWAKLQPRDGQYSVRRVRPDLPLGVDLAIEGLTRPDPSERYATAGAAVEELARAFYAGHGRVEGTIFLSYARADAAYVHDLAARLRGIGLKVWYDHDIEPGANWDRSIETALQDANSMLVVMSPAAAASETVADEWSYFLDCGKTVYPLLYEPCELPLRLRRRQHVALTRELLTDVSRIVQALGAAASRA